MERMQRYLDLWVVAPACIEALCTQVKRERFHTTLNKLGVEAGISFHIVHATLAHQVMQLIVAIHLMCHRAEKAVAVAWDRHNFQRNGLCTQCLDVLGVTIRYLRNLPVVLSIL